MPEGCRVYAVGDVHGRADLLEALFARIDADTAARKAVRPVEIYLGDYIDRGPRSRDVVDLMIARRAARETVQLRGNHETYIVRFLDDPGLLRTWRRFGGLETLLSYGLRPSLNPDDDELAALSAALKEVLPAEHLAFFRALPTKFSLGDFFFVHAGVKPGVPLAAQDDQDLIWIRDPFLMHDGLYEKTVVHGHTPVPEPEVKRNRIDIDTGAFATGRLTCLVIEGQTLAWL
ncbi:putative serine/threonine protein phosphatase [Rhodovulum sp. PH10]|nr:putative serine/threonine protein phosphatase [Rhodovulum sp. PH10]